MRGLGDIQNVIRRHLPWQAPDESFRKAYRSLLQQTMCRPAPGYAATLQRLALKRPERRELAFSLQELRVIGFGTDDDWRRNGLWAALRRLTDFHLFEVPDGPYRGCREEVEERRLKEQDLLQFLDERERARPVHVVFFSHSGRHISNQVLETLRQRGIWTVVMSVDDKHQFLYPCDGDGTPHQLRVAPQADLYWTNWPLAVDLVNARGGAAWFAPPGANGDVYRPLGCERDLDVVFVGSCYGVRRQIVQRLRRYVRVEAYGRGWPDGVVSFDETIRLFSRAKVVLGVSGVGPTLAVQTLKGRDFEVPMCGTAYLTSYNFELADCFDIGREIVCYNSVEDCLECSIGLLRDPPRCAAVGRAARERCLRDHTWDHRVRELFRLLAP